jgi:hypothetical protein
VGSGGENGGAGEHFGLRRQAERAAALEQSSGLTFRRKALSSLRSASAVKRSRRRFGRTKTKTFALRRICKNKGHD